MMQALHEMSHVFLGTLIGGFISWILALKSAVNKERRDALIEISKAIQDYRAVYAQFYVEYVSPIAQETKGNFRSSEPKESSYLEAELMIDKLRGRLRTMSLMLLAYFPANVTMHLYNDIQRLLQLTSHNSISDCRTIDEISENTTPIIISLLKKYRQPFLFA